MRIQKYLSQIGVCSRRKAEELIAGRKVKVNDVICKIGQDIDENEYEVTTDKRLSNENMYTLQNEMKIDRNEKVKGIKIKGTKVVGSKYVITVVLKEGKNRQLRKIFGMIGHKIFSLKRTRINNLTLGQIKKG